MGKPILIGLIIITINSLIVCAQDAKHEKQDPCLELRFMPLGNEAPTITATDVRNLPRCLNGKFIRLVGIYRVAFENSDLYDPTGNGGSTWISFDQFYSAVKRCSSPAALKLLDREKGGTFGFVAMGAFHSGGGFGHMNGWDNELQVICLESLINFSESGSLLEYQRPEVRKRISEWYGKNLRK
jgi:hypothetical protein